MSEADLVVVSPGVPRAAGARGGRGARAFPCGARWSSAARSLRTRRPIVAIGGTNGKSTTTSLVGAMLEAHGLRDVRRGQPRRAARRPRGRAFDAVVLEVSSFQMERVDTFRPHVRDPAQRDRRPPRPLREVRRRTRAPRATRSHGRPREDIAVVPGGDAICARAGAAREGARVVTFGPGGTLDVTRRRSSTAHRRALRAPARSPLVGGHNALNAAAAIAASRPFGGRAEPTIRRVLQTFHGLPHRMALVGRDRRRSLLRRLEGDERGRRRSPRSRGSSSRKPCSSPAGATRRGSYAPLVEALRAQGRAAVLIGEAADAHRAGDRRRASRSTRAATLDEPCARAPRSREPATPSSCRPACSSYDMFRDYKHRGDEFVRAVRALGRQRRRTDEPSAEHSHARSPSARSRPLDAKADAKRLAPRPMDPVLAAVVVALVGFGVVMVYSASAVQATVQHHDPQFFLKRQAAYAGARALLTLFATSRHRLPPALQAHLPDARRRRRAPPRVRRRLRSLGRRRGALARHRPDSRPARRDGQARARHLARLLAREEGRAGEDVHRRVPAAPASWPACSCSCA